MDHKWKLPKGLQAGKNYAFRIEKCKTSLQKFQGEREIEKYNRSTSNVWGEILFFNDVNFFLQF